MRRARVLRAFALLALLPCGVLAADACGTYGENDPSSEAATDATAEANESGGDAEAGGEVADGGEAGDASPDANACVRATCADGAPGGCSGRCPSLSSPEFVTTERVEGGFVYLRNEGDCNVYECMVLFQPPDSGFDCQNPPIGRRGRICSVGSCASIAIGVSNVASCVSEQCTYGCDFAK